MMMNLKTLSRYEFLLNGLHQDLLHQGFKISLQQTENLLLSAKIVMRTVSKNGQVPYIKWATTELIRYVDGNFFYLEIELIQDKLHATVIVDTY